MKLAHASLLSVLICSVYAAEPSAQQLKLAQPGRTLISDNFMQPEKPNRRLTRGDWIVTNGVAVCAHDEELFKKFKNHGPAIWYDQEFTDGVIRFEFLASPECKHFVVTVNGREGHVFRFVMNEAGTDIRAWDADHKAKQLAKTGPPLPKAIWTPVAVELIGDEACVHIGDKYEVVVEDASYTAPKTVVGVSFHYGSVQLRNFELMQAMPK
jgi:hypothetical protein